MTQHDAKTAVRHLQRKIREIRILSSEDADEIILTPAIISLQEDVDDLAKQLNQSKQPQPNCRPCTPDELRQLCTASNVIAFVPAA